MSGSDELRLAWQQRPLVLDGGMGTALIQRGLPKGASPDLWNLENPTAVEQVHRDFLAAGADLLLTNTFGASPARLAPFGAAERVSEVNQQGVKLARQAMGEAQNSTEPRRFVAGDIGPATLRYAEQAQVLIDAGVDAIVIETMYELREFVAAIKAVRAVSPSIPLIAMMTFDGETTYDGTKPETVVESAERLGCDAVGANCSNGPEEMLPVIKRMAEVQSRCLLAAKPSAGLPKIGNGRTDYPYDAQTMAKYIEPFLELGVRLLGGCCGTTPEFTQMIRRYVNSPCLASRVSRE